MTTTYDSSEFSRERMRNLADAHYGYARYLTKLESKQHFQYIASSFLIAASLRSILEPSESAEAFRESARFYRLDNNSFWRVVAICGNARSLFEENVTSESEKRYTALPEFQFHMMLSSQFQKSRNPGFDFFPDSRFLSMPVGRLQIPMNLYVNTFHEMQEISSASFRSKGGLESLVILLQRAAEPMELLQSDKYHWRKLMGTFIPVEPEILATCICLLVNLQRTSRVTSQELMETVTSNVIARRPLQLASDIVGF